ncbi:EAL domain-containing protein [Halobacillus sp. Nhm2S1]|uniref:EAL domain-containing protein n=1 Tax=Halobacillus sp. Nhm2S1 TaxID=2866716 RepID=UPI001C7382B9|nr:EAL domain-containing protein [Halobacillus sp. Nhm2S1]MBX0357090.1 EAL domain-containing protein [Halobacillus sp. Nhm2S1]
MSLAQQRECKSSEDVLASYMNEDKLFIHYQPIVDLHKDNVIGFEALTRFPPNASFKSPVELFQLAAQTNRLFQLEKHTRKLAIDSITPYLQKDQQLWVNLTPNVVHDDSFTPGFTHTVLQNTKVNPAQIVFEITEHSAISDFQSFRKLLEHYREQGFKVAIDDVGAGYSSMQMISELKPDYLKIDRSLITHIDQLREKQYMVEALQHIGKKLGAGIIAEGVETEGECHHLIQMGVSLMQGYYFGKPDFPPPPLPRFISKQVEQQRNNQWFPLKIDEHTTFSELMRWISTYEGSYDHRFAMNDTPVGKEALALTEVVRFAASHSEKKEELIGSHLRSWFT